MRRRAVPARRGPESSHAVRSIVNSGAPLRSSSSRASVAVAAQAPIRCGAIRRCTPDPRSSAYRPRCSRSSAEKSASWTGSQLRRIARGFCRALRTPFDVHHVAPGRHAEGRSHVVVSGLDLVDDHPGARRLVRPGQVVVEAGQLDRALDQPVHHLGADAALADEQALGDELLDRPAHGRAGQAEPVGELDLVLEPRRPGPGRRSRSRPRSGAPPGSRAAPGSTGPHRWRAARPRRTLLTAGWSHPVEPSGSESLTGTMSDRQYVVTNY